MGGPGHWCRDQSLFVPFAGGQQLLSIEISRQRRPFFSIPNRSPNDAGVLTTRIHPVAHQDNPPAALPEPQCCRSGLNSDLAPP
jgi:hypothetical protein